MKRLLIFLLAATAATLSANPIRQASEARLWLNVPLDQPPLGEVEVSAGSVNSADWEKDPAVRERKTDITFPLRWWSWKEVEISFTPQQDGTVDLMLNGPWAADEGGQMPRQEILWDDIRAEGTEVVNGGFEAWEDNAPKGWTSPWKPYLAPTEWPIAGPSTKEGKSVGASWINRPLVQNLVLKAGQKVTLRLHARAATPPGFVAPVSPGNDTPAHKAAAAIKRGVNLGNGWEAPPPNGWGVKFTTEDIDRIANEGFDHIRVPVGWHFHLKEKDGSYVIDPAFLTEIEPVLRRAMERKLHVMLNWHHFHDLTQDPAKHEDRFIRGWDSIARHFASWPPALFFELLNEPCDALTTEVANDIYQKTITSIRKSNPQRIIVASPGHWGIIGELDRLRLPDDDDRILVTVHSYEPFQFTHQGAGWVGLQALKGVVYPGPPATPLAVPESLKDNSGLVYFLNRYNTLPTERNPSSPRVIRELMDTASAWSKQFGRPVHLGEFGANSAGDMESRRRYLRDVRTLAEERGIPWTLWEWKAGFGYWDPENKQPRFHSSLFE